jgi:hypothetical protein
MPLMPVRLLPLTLLLALLLALPGAARAEFFPADPIDGPGADIRSVGDVDVARDGSGAVAYVRRDAGVDHVWVSRLVSGIWQSPTRVDNAVAGAGSPSVAASDGGRLLVAFTSDGGVFTAAWPSGGQGFTPPAQLAAAGTNPSADMSINGVAYVSFTAPGASAADVRIARFERDQGAGALIPAPVDIDPSRDAGDGAAKRSRTVVSADGVALVVWGEAGGDGRDHVVARRVFGMNLSTAPQDLTLNDLNGAPAGSADSPDVDVEDDSSYAWVVFRQALALPGGTRKRAIARRLVGSQFEAPAVVDGLGDAPAEDSVTPHVDISGKGQGLAGSSGSASHAAFGAILKEDAFLPGQRLDAGDNAVDPGEVPVVAENADSVLAWRTTAGGPLSVHARRFDAIPLSRNPPPPGPDVTLSRPEFGPVDADAGMDAASNRVGDVVVVFVQGTGPERRLVAGVFDRVPSSFAGYTTTSWRPFARPPLSWQPAFDLWGPVNYSVEVDGKAVGQTTETKFAPLDVVPDGLHTWRVVATDRRGQVVRSKPRVLRVDATPPSVAFRVRGTRKAGKAVKVDVTASDVAPVRSSGVKVVKIDFGDGTIVAARAAEHRYKRGSYTIRVSATDRAGNAGVLTRDVRIKKK